jgi:hypothetical protein
MRARLLEERNRVGSKLKKPHRERPEASGERCVKLQGF